MKKISLMILSLVVFASVNALAAAKTYQVTGPILDVTDSTIVVQKGTEKWEVQKDAAMKVTGDLKKGNKVTIEYIMTAKTVDVKGGDAKAPAKTDAKAAAPAAKPAAKTDAKTK